MFRTVTPAIVGDYYPSALRQLLTLVQLQDPDVQPHADATDQPSSNAHYVRCASRTPNLNGDQIGELRRDIRHAVFSRTKPVTRGQHGAFIVEFIKGGAVNDGYQLAPMQQH